MIGQVPVIMRSQFNGIPDITPATDLVPRHQLKEPRIRSQIVFVAECDWRGVTVRPNLWFSRGAENTEQNTKLSSRRL